MPARFCHGTTMVPAWRVKRPDGIKYTIGCDDVADLPLCEQVKLHTLAVADVACVVLYATACTVRRIA